MLERYVSSEEGEIIHHRKVYEFVSASYSDSEINELVVIFCLSRGVSGLVPSRMYYKVTHKLPLSFPAGVHRKSYIIHCEPVD